MKPCVSRVRLRRSPDARDTRRSRLPARVDMLPLLERHNLLLVGPLFAFLIRVLVATWPYSGRSIRSSLFAK